MSEDTTQKPTLGRVVLLKLSAYDAEAINRRRSDAATDVAYRPSRGYIVHVGNEASKGDVVPADIVNVFDDGLVNLQAKLDGNDTFWAVGRREGHRAGQWSWPPQA